MEALRLLYHVLQKGHDTANISMVAATVFLKVVDLLPKRTQRPSTASIAVSVQVRFQLPGQGFGSRGRGDRLANIRLDGGYLCLTSPTSVCAVATSPCRAEKEPLPEPEICSKKGGVGINQV